jgi:NAD(P)-dependent dehydrogenase (short-subunit alcohol dehydrogenase family)
MFSGKATIITGANKNLGKQTAIAFAKEGSNILLHYHSSSSADETRELADCLIKNYDVNAIIFQGDLSTEKATTELFDTAISAFGKIDYAINNVGMVLRKNLVDVSLDEFNTMYRVNVTSSFLFLREAERKVAENGSVVMLTTSLLAAYADGYSIYQSAKSAVYWMTKTASKETKKQITYNCISPGPMDTPFLYGQENEHRVEFFKTQAIQQRLTEVDDIVPIIKFIVKDGKWMTGQNLFANNGFTAPTA